MIQIFCSSMKQILSCFKIEEHSLLALIMRTKKKLSKVGRHVDQMQNIRPTRTLHDIIFSPLILKIVERPFLIYLHIHVHIVNYMSENGMGIMIRGRRRQILISILFILQLELYGVHLPPQKNFRNFYFNAEKSDCHFQNYFVISNGKTN